MGSEKLFVIGLLLIAFMFFVGLIVGLRHEVNTLDSLRHKLINLYADYATLAAKLAACEAESAAYYKKAIEYEHLRFLYGDPGHRLGVAHQVKQLEADLARVTAERDETALRRSETIVMSDQLQAENARVRAERDAYQHLEETHRATCHEVLAERDTLKAENPRLRGLIEEIVNSSVEWKDPRIHYRVVQIDNRWFDEAEAARLRVALESIAANTCCGTCQEAALVAKAALSEATP